MRPKTDLKAYVRGRLSGQWTRPVLVAGICLTAEMIHLALLLPFAAAGGPLPEAIGMVVSFILSLLSYLLVAGQASYHLAFLRGEEPAILDMFRIFREQPDRFLILGFFWFLPELLPNLSAFLPESPAVRVLIFAVTVLALAILRTRYALAVYLLTDNPKLGAFEAMRMSAAFMQKRKLRLLGLVLSFVGYYILGILSIGIGLLFVFPYFHLTLASFYLEVLSRVSKQP